MTSNTPTKNFDHVQDSSSSQVQTNPTSGPQPTFQDQQLSFQMPTIKSRQERYLRAQVCFLFFADPTKFLRISFPRRHLIFVEFFFFKFFFKFC
jgi:hypothetical protein